MLRTFIHDAVEWTTRVVTHPREELTHWQATARFWYDLARVGARQLQQDRALQMAAALAFHTLFALMPLAIVSTALFKGMQGVDKLQSLVHQLVQTAGLDAVRIMPADGAAATGGVESISLGTWLEDMIGKFGTIDLETLGLLGLAVMMYAAVAMMVTVEDCFNTIYRAPQGRPWLRRVPVYWTVLTVGPIGIALLFLVDTHVGRWIASVDASGSLIRLLGVVWSIGLITLMLLGTFVLLPNTHVSWRSAVGGAFVSAVLLHVGKVGLAAYVNNAFSFSQLYGPLGFVPVLMIWTYAMWICILFGVEVAAIVQRLGGRRDELEEMERMRLKGGMVDSTSVLLLMEVVAEGFESGQAVSLVHVVEETGLPEPVAAEILGKLVAQGFVHRVAGVESAYTLARPPEDITAESLIEFGHGMLHERNGRRKSRAIEALRHSQRELAANTTLAGLGRLSMG
ncbi:MAG: YihY family inner membrane protein [Planctomycetia bacterium]|nr:YihY family inner membrane protein [Planctomycetia bacterium]